MMTPTHVASLRADVAVFAAGRSKLNLSEVIQYVTGRGWNPVHHEMFADWLEQQGFQVQRTAAPVIAEKGNR